VTEAKQLTIKKGDVHKELNEMYLCSLFHALIHLKNYYILLPFSKNILLFLEKNFEFSI